MSEFSYSGHVTWSHDSAHILGDSIDSVTVEEVPCTVMSMDFFGRLTTAGKLSISPSEDTSLPPSLPLRCSETYRRDSQVL